MVEISISKGGLVVRHRGRIYDLIGKERLGMEPLWVKKIRGGKESLWLGGGRKGAFTVEVDDEGRAFRIDTVKYTLPFTPVDGALFRLGPVVWGEGKVGIVKKDGSIVEVGGILNVHINKEGRGIIVGRDIVLVLGDKVSGIRRERLANMEGEKVVFKEEGGLPLVIIEEGSKKAVIALGGEREGHFSFKEDKKGAFHTFKK